MTADEQKKAMAAYLLALEPCLLFDGTRPDVDIPDFLRKPEQVFRLVHNIRDLVFGPTHWSATLTTNGQAYGVRIPWDAVTRMWFNGGPLILWPEPEPEAAPPVSPDPKPSPRKGLRLV